MSTAQGDMNDKLRNHGLPVPKQADTAEPMSAGERAQHLFFGTTYPDRIVQKVAEQIRQAEQAAYERVAAHLERIGARYHQGRDLREHVRALAQQPEKVE